MWFRNLVPYRLGNAFRHSPEELSQALAAQAFRPCGGLDPFSYGWVSPLGPESESLVHAAGGWMLLTACREERLLPAAVVSEAVAERVAEIEHQQDRTVRAKERKRIRDDAFFSLLPRAFTHKRLTRACLSPAQGWLLVDAASARRAEDLVGLLVHCVRGLEIERHAPDGIAEAMTAWVANATPPPGFAIGESCELRDQPEDGAVVRCQRQDLGGEEILAHIRAGKRVRQLALGFRERLSFTLGSDLHLKRLRFEAVDELDDLDQADAAARLDADFAFMTAEIGALLGVLAEVFGRGGTTPRG